MGTLTCRRARHGLCVNSALRSSTWRPQASFRCRPRCGERSWRRKAVEVPPMVHRRCSGKQTRNRVCSSATQMRASRRQSRQGQGARMNRLRARPPRLRWRKYRASNAPSIIPACLSRRCLHCAMLIPIQPLLMSPRRHSPRHQRTISHSSLVAAASPAREARRRRENVCFPAQARGGARLHRRPSARPCPARTTCARCTASRIRVPLLRGSLCRLAALGIRFLF